jgi:hypothetical protein
MSPAPAPEPESRAAPAGPPWRRHARLLTAAAVVALLVVGMVLIRGFWIRIQSDYALQELAQVAGLMGAQRVEHLERMAARYAGTDTDAQIRYQLGRALRDDGRLEQAERILRQVAREAPDSEWGRLAAEAARGVVASRAADAATVRRMKTLESDEQARRRFQGGEDGDPRDARLPAPRRPDAADGDDPRRATPLEKP